MSLIYSFIINTYIAHNSTLPPTERVVGLVRGFNSGWKRSMELINQENITSFSNFKNGTQILQVGLGGKVGFGGEKGLLGSSLSEFL